MRAYLELLRLPNVFTAMADILLGFLFTHEQLQPWPQFALLLGASSSLYLAGMVLNDFFDQAQDARERPARPIPSGRVSAKTARRLGFGMLALGAALGWAAGMSAGEIRPALVAMLLATAVLIYDGVLKKTPLAPLVMGACRMLNVLLGMSVAAQSWQAVNWLVAGGIGLYIVGVTVFARTEARESDRPQLILGMAILLGGIALLAWLPHWATGEEWPAIRIPQRWNLFWSLIGLLAGWRCLRAIVDPRPALVQAAVKNCIFSLVVLDAGACLAVQDTYWGLVILSLLVPTTMLGRWVYST
ncbi:MAG: UbiA family prenyltransferase [Planctomycetia bacterium]|nr:UbiA family prenyltransferase [Planctomycetia bacterium]